MGLTAAEGKAFVDMNSDRPITIAQTVSTVIGATYEVSFKLNHNPYCASSMSFTSYTGYAEIRTASSTASCTSLRKLDFSHPKTPTPWTTISFKFTATTAKSELLFKSTMDGEWCGPVIDDVKIIFTENIIENGSFETAKIPEGHSKKWYAYKADQAIHQIAPWTANATFEIDTKGIFALNLTNHKVLLSLMILTKEML